MAEATLQLKSWAIGETVTGSKLNTHLSNQLNTLYNKSLSLVHREAVEGYQATAIAGADTFTNFTQPIKLVHNMQHEGVIKIGMWIDWQVTRYVGTANWAEATLDIKVDDDWYVSSRTSTPLTDGLLIHAMNALSRPYTVYCTWYVPDIAAGLHTYELIQKVSNSNFGAVVNEVEISVEQYGKSLSEQTIYGEPV